MVSFSQSVRGIWRALERNPLPALLAAAAVFLYWFLRIRYWYLVREQPFSDTFDYVNVAYHILDSFTFAEVPFWSSFWAPGLPASIAGVFLIFGKGNQTAWQFSQTFLNFAAALWMCIELGFTTRKQNITIYLWIVAVSKSSIFWSLKFATESLVETQSYLILALLLSIWRNPRVWKYVVLGVLFSYSFLTKTTIFAALPIVTLIVIMSRRRNSGTGWRRRLSDLRNDWQLSVVSLACLYLGIFLIWVPWMIRSYRLYHHVVPFTTHQPLAMLWEQWSYTIKLDDHLVTRSESDFFHRGPHEFRNDYELYRFASLFAERWYIDQWQQFPTNISRRVVRVFTEDTDLTTVSRNRLFGSWIDVALIDKSCVIFLVSVLMVGVGVFRGDPIQLGMAAVFLVPILVIISMSGLPRLFEPYIPLAAINTVITMGKFTGWGTCRELVVRRKNAGSAVSNRVGSGIN